MKPKKIEETEEEKQARELTEQIAENIQRLSNSVSVLLGGKLKKKTILLLLAWSSGIPQYQVERVLDAIATMDKDFIK